jgi:hypothetical protein
VTFEIDVLQLLLCILDTIALKFAIGLHKLVAMIFAVNFEIIIQRAVGNEPCYLIKKDFNNYIIRPKIGVEKNNYTSHSVKFVKNLQIGFR